MPQLLETLRAQFTETSDQVRALSDEIASNEDGVATDDQAANLETLSTTLEGLGPRIEQARALADRMHAGAELLAGVPNVSGSLDRVRSTNVELSEFMSWGEYARALANGDVAAPTADAIDRMMLLGEMTARERMVDHARAIVDSTTANTAGILPPAWLTNIVDYLGILRPTISAFSTQPLPSSGMTVNFPTVTVRPLVGKQTTEKTDVSSRATTIVAGSAAVATYGGGEDISVQVIQRTDPSYLAIVNELYAEELATKEDADAATTLVAAVPAGGANNLTLSAATNGSDINKQLAAAGKQILSVRGNLDTFVMGLDLWAYVVGAADSTGRPLFPTTGPNNPVGQSAINVSTGNARGLTFVADPNMAATVGVAGDSRAFTSMLGGVQTMRADNPQKLGTDYAVFEFAAFAVRRPSALVKFTLGA